GPNDSPASQFRSIAAAGLPGSCVLLVSSPSSIIFIAPFQKASHQPLLYPRLEHYCPGRREDRPSGWDSPVILQPLLEATQQLNRALQRDTVETYSISRTQLSDTPHIH